MADPLPTASTLSVSTPIVNQVGSSQGQTITSGPSTGSAPTPAASTPAAAGSNIQYQRGSKALKERLSSLSGNLAKDRVTIFEEEVKNKQILDRMEYVLKREGGAHGRLILETACNRAMFGGSTLRSILFNPEYFHTDADPTGTKTTEHTKFTLDMIQKVIYNGANDTDLCTDQGYNMLMKKTGKLFLQPFFDGGCTGSWFDLKDGKKITDPARINKLTTTPGNGMEEYIYRKDGRGHDCASTAGLNAKTYKLKYNIQPTSPSTFDSNVPLPKELQNAVKSDLTGEPARTLTDDTSPAVVSNTDPHGPTVVKNTNDCPKGMFAFPGVGAMVWVFFREGNPLFPVYFAASYSSGEWKGAYGGASLSPDGTNNGTAGTQVASTLKMNPNAGGGLEFTHIKDNSDPSGAGDKTVAMMYGDDGSNMMFSKGYHQIYTRHDRRDQIDGHLYKIVGGCEEQWIEEDSNNNIRGNLIVKVGKIDGETTEAMKELASFSKQMNKMLLNNPGS